VPGTQPQQSKANKMKDKLYRIRHIWIIFGKGLDTFVKMARQAHFSFKIFTAEIFFGPMAPVHRKDPDMKHSSLKQISLLILFTRRLTFQRNLYNY